MKTNYIACVLISIATAINMVNQPEMHVIEASVVIYCLLGVWLATEYIVCQQRKLIKSLQDKINEITNR